jgi:glucokinase
MDYYIAVDIGGTQIRAALFDDQSIKPLRLKRISTHGDNKPIDRLRDLIKEILPGSGKVRMIGIAAPGPVDPIRGMIYTAPNIAGWTDIPLTELVQTSLDIPVRIGNDANMALLGEWKYGAGQGHHNLVYLTISTGIGGGVILNDHLLLGTKGLATELGHVTILPDGPMCNCGQRGHLEALSSGTAIARWVNEALQSGRPSSLSRVSEITALKVFLAAKQGDKLAIEAFEFAGMHLGRTLANYIHIFNPSIIILGGGVINSGDFILKPMRETMAKYVISPQYLDPLTITTAKLKDQSGLLGALVLVRS